MDLAKFAQQILIKSYGFDKEAAIDKQKELQLWKDAVGGNTQARDQLYVELKPIVTKAVNRFQVSNVPRAVLEAKAYQIIHNSLGGYNPEKAQLNTYLINQLQQLNRTVAEYADVGYIPEQRQLNINAYKTGIRTLQDKFNREPTTPEIADYLNWNKKEVERLRKELRGTFLEDQSIMTNYTERNKDMDAIEYVYGMLEPQSQLVMESVMGLHGKEPKTLQETATNMGLTVDQVRHLKDKIRVKLEGALSGGNYGSY